jgi:hypothetical protein
MEVVPFQGQLDPALRLGEGRSRTSAEKAQLFELKIWLPGQGAMRDLIRAESLQQALTFAANRYPNCKVEVPDRRRRKSLSWCAPSVGRKKRPAKTYESWRLSVNSQVTELDKKNWAAVVLDQGRANFLEKLYWKDGRSMIREHPYHHTYTGLYQEYLAQKGKKS